jgi:hypothetical protein
MKNSVFRDVALSGLRTDVSEERVASIFMVRRIGAMDSVSSIKHNETHSV